jgi:hypothetical protein
MKLDQVLRDTIKVISKDYEQHAVSDNDILINLCHHDNDISFKKWMLKRY